jgi:phage-related protein
VKKQPESKPCGFIGSSRKDIKRFPAKVQNRLGYALHMVQEGDEPAAAKALKGFGGRAVLELIDDFDSNPYRAVQCVLPERFMSSTHFKRRPRRVSPRLCKISNSSSRACVMQNCIIAKALRIRAAIHDETQN